MPEEITIKQVLDSEGYFNHLELHQGDNVIKLYMMTGSENSGNQLYKWSVLKEIIDGIKLAKPESSIVDKLILQILYPQPKTEIIPEEP